MLLILKARKVQCGGLGRIAVLGDEVAGITGQGNVFHGALRAGADIDHFRDIKEMVSHVVTRVLASASGFFNDFGKVLPTGIVEDFLKISRHPEFNARIWMLLNKPLEIRV